jgi:hypothetical protein
VANVWCKAGHCMMSPHTGPHDKEVLFIPPQIRCEIPRPQSSDSPDITRSSMPNADSSHPWHWCYLGPDNSLWQEFIPCSIPGPSLSEDNDQKGVQTLPKSLGSNSANIFLMRPVAHTCNPSYSGVRDQEDQSSKPTWANSSWDPISKTQHKTELLSGTSGRAPV